MSDTMSKAERLGGAAVIQRSLMNNPTEPFVGVGIPRGEAVRLANTLRGHDFIRLDEKVYDAFNEGTGELSSIVAEILDRMSAVEYDEVIGRLVAALSGPDSVENAPSARLDALAARISASRPPAPQWDVAKLKSLTGGDPGDETKEVEVVTTEVFVIGEDGWRPATAAERSFLASIGIAA